MAGHTLVLPNGAILVDRLLSSGHLGTPCIGQVAGLGNRWVAVFVTALKQVEVC